MKENHFRDHKLISIWLFAGVIMIFFQIMLGGITRLTGSGLSITRWEIVTGTLPPLTTLEWEYEFDLYKQTPQYQEINQGMTLAEFKFIFFWEYLHRLWARLMGLVFIIPFFYFLFRKSLDIKLLRRLGIVILLASLAAIFGWVMVASGLISRPWVNAYKLTIHLGLGISLFVFLFFTWLSHRGYRRININPKLSLRLKILLILVIIQMAFGGFISGMKAALNYPTWPLMHGEFIPQLLLQKTHWNSHNFLMYDSSGFMPALVQFIHRNLGYIIFMFSIVLSIRLWKEAVPRSTTMAMILVGIVIVQVSLGILTLLHSVGSIPISYGVLHQAGAIILITYLFYIYLVTKPLKTNYPGR